MKRTTRDTRPVIYFRQFAGRWEMKIPSSTHPALRAWRVIPQWPGLDAFVATCNDNGYNVVRE